MNLTRECLSEAIKQKYPEVAGDMANVFVRKGVRTLSDLENLPRRMSSPVAYGVSVYEVVHFVVSVLRATGCGEASEDVSKPITPVAVTHTAILGDQSGAVPALRTRREPKEKKQ